MGFLADEIRKVESGFAGDVLAAVHAKGQHEALLALLGRVGVGEGVCRVRAHGVGAGVHGLDLVTHNELARLLQVGDGVQDAIRAVVLVAHGGGHAHACADGEQVAWALVLRPSWLRERPFQRLA